MTQSTLASLLLKKMGALPEFNFSNFYDGYLSDEIIAGFLPYTWMQFLKPGRRKQHVLPKRRCRSINIVEKQTAII